MFDHAYTSTLTRTQQTIERITDMSYERVEDLREWGYGAFEGERVSLMPPSPRGDFSVPFGGRRSWTCAVACVMLWRALWGTPDTGRCLP